MRYKQNYVKCSFMMEGSFETVMSGWISFPYISKVCVLPSKTLYPTDGI